MAESLLLTGATGFIGRTILLECLRNNYYRSIVIPLRDPEKLYRQLQRDGIYTLPGELTITDWNDGAQKYKVDHVIHCAGVLFSTSREDYHSVNVQGTRRLLESLSGNPRVILISSQSVGGPTPSSLKKRDETTPDTPLTEYGKSKKMMEEIVFQEFSHLNSLMLRAPMVLGARDQAIRPLFAMAKFRIRLKPGYRLKTFSWIAVDDLVSALFTSLNADSEVWEKSPRILYVSSNDLITDEDLIKGAIEVCGGKKGLLIRLPQPFVKVLSILVDTIPGMGNLVPSLTRDRAKEIWPWRWIIDSTLFQNRFHWSAKETLMETLAQIAQWEKIRLAK